MFVPFDCRAAAVHPSFHVWVKFRVVACAVDCDLRAGERYSTVVSLGACVWIVECARPGRPHLRAPALNSGIVMRGMFGSVRTPQVCSRNPQVCSGGVRGAYILYIYMKPFFE